MEKNKVVLIITDGLGIAPAGPGNAVALAQTPVLDRVWAGGGRHFNFELLAHGHAVGLSEFQMGTSEVGHYTIANGQIVDHQSLVISRQINSGKLWKKQTWKKIIERGKNSATVHLLGLLSDGGVHSYSEHLFSMLKELARENVPRVRIHVLFDGRDVGPHSADQYVDELETRLKNYKNLDYKIASGGGRANITMDRGNNNWPMVELGWKTHVLGEGEEFHSACDAILAFRTKLDETMGRENYSDENLPPFICKGYKGMQNGDVLMLFNYRTDRMIQWVQMWESDVLPLPVPQRPDILLTSIFQYDAQLKLPKYYMIGTEEIPDQVECTLSEFIADKGGKICAVSETSKYPHVTRFFVRQTDKAPPHETWIPIENSEKVYFEKKPQMKAKEIVNKVVMLMKEQKADLIRVNFPNPDMVGHRANLGASIAAVEAVDSALGEIIQATDNHIILFGGDHGNAEMCYQVKENMLEPKTDEFGSLMRHTCHTLNPVRWSIVLPNSLIGKFSPNSLTKRGLANLSATTATLMGYKSFPKNWHPSLMDFVEK